MYQSEDILECARTVHPYLTDLLGVQANAVDRELTSLLTRADAGEKVDNLVLELLGRYTPTRDWARRYLKGDEELRDYSKLPGSPTPIPSSGPKYVCPRCGFRWVQRTAGQSAPPCPRHGNTLVPITATP